MKIFRILIATSFLLLLSGCDRGTMNPNYQCGMKADGQKVMGYNSQICSENSEYQSLYMTNPDFTVDLINDTNEAKTGIPALYKKDEALSIYNQYLSFIFKKLQTTITDVALWMIALYLIYSVFQTLFELSRMSLQHLEQTEERYSFKILGWNYCKFALLFVFIMPIGMDGNSFFNRYFYGTSYKIGQENFAFTISTISAGEQQGETESTPLSQDTRQYSSVYWSSWALNNMTIKGKLRDNRTAKLEYHEAIMQGGQYVLPVEHSDSEPYIFRTGDKIELKRYTVKDEAQKQVKARSLLSYSGKVTFNRAGITSRDADSLIAGSPTTYISTQPSEIPAKAKAMIDGMVSIHGEEIRKNPEAINRAIISGVLSSMPYLVETYMKKEQPAVNEITRLVEELFCTQTPLNTETKFLNETFIKNIAAKKFFEPNMINRCIGQNGSKYISYGIRPYSTVETEVDKKYKDLIDRGYEYLVSIVGATKDITVNEDTAEYCKKARVGGLRGAILYTDKCVYANTLQAEYSDYITNSFIAESVGFDHYIDTESRKGDDWYKYSPAMNDDFDPYIERLFKTVSVKVTQGQVSQEAYLRAMADSYDEKATGIESIVNMFTSPIETLKAYVGMDTDKPDPMKVKAGVQKMFVKGVSIGTTMFMSGTVATGIDNVMEMNKDQSKKTDIGYSGKGTGKVNWLTSKFVKLMKSMTMPGLIVGLTSVMGLIYFALPKLIFIFLAFNYAAQFQVHLMNGALTLVKMARLDDRDNFAHHLNKLFNSFGYIVFTPVILYGLYCMVMVFEGEGLAYTSTQLMKTQTHTLMDSIAFIFNFVATIGVVTQAILATSIICYQTIMKEMFGLDETPSIAEHALNISMFVVKWSVPFVGLLLHLFTMRKK